MPEDTPILFLMCDYCLLTLHRRTLRIFAMGTVFAILFSIRLPPLRILVNLISISAPIAVHRGFLTSPFLPHFHPLL
ncbi:hypothetical protein M1N19_01410, partial [Dehalococcoidia bacterium]|nr:hypothetical protein [Dehalococcoidia bacterium]